MHYGTELGDFRFYSGILRGAARGRITRVCSAPSEAHPSAGPSTLINRKQNHQAARQEHQG